MLRDVFFKVITASGLRNVSQVVRERRSDERHGHTAEEDAEKPQAQMEI